MLTSDAGPAPPTHPEFQGAPPPPRVSGSPPPPRRALSHEAHAKEQRQLDSQGGFQSLIPKRVLAAGSRGTKSLFTKMLTLRVQASQPGVRAPSSCIARLPPDASAADRGLGLRKLGFSHSHPAP